MKRFFAIFAGWLVVLFLLVFFLGGWMFEENGSHWQRPLVPLALLLAGFCAAIAEQWDELETLKKRLNALKQLSGGKAPSPQPLQGQPPAQK